MRESSYSPFGAIKTAKQDVQFAINPDDGLTRKRYWWESNDTGFDKTLVSDSPGQITISTRSGEPNDSASIRPAYSGQYVAQGVGQPGMAVEVNEENIVEKSDGGIALSHGRIRFGPFWYRNGQIESGWGIEIDTDGARAFRISEGEHQGDSPIPQKKWNVDSINGKGESRRRLELEKSYVFNFPYTWYNSNQLHIGIVDKFGDAQSEPEDIQILHSFQPESAPSINKPNVAINLIVENNGTGDSLTASLGGTQYSTYGGENGDETRKTPAWSQTSGGFITSSINDPIDPVTQPGEPLMAVKREDGSYDLEIKLLLLKIWTDTDLRLYFWDVYDESALTGANFTEISSPNFSTESKLLTDTDSTDFDSTNAVFRGTETTDGGAKKNEIEAITNDNVDDKIPIDAIRVITAVATHGTGPGDVSPLEAKFTESY